VIHRRCRRANMVSTYPKLLVAYLPGIVLVCLAGIVLAAGLVALYPCRDARDTRFDALTVTIAGAPLGYTTYDRAVVRGVQEQLARSSVLQFPALLASLVLPRPFRAGPAPGKNSHPGTTVPDYAEDHAAGRARKDARCRIHSTHGASPSTRPLLVWKEVGARPDGATGAAAALARGCQTGQPGRARQLGTG